MTYKYRFNLCAAMPEHVGVDYTSTGPCGGDAGHGGSSTLIMDSESAIFNVALYDENGEEIVERDGVKEVVISVAGDWEMEGLELALRFLGSCLSAKSAKDVEKL